MKLGYAGVQFLVANSTTSSLGPVEFGMGICHSRSAEVAWQGKGHRFCRECGDSRFWGLRFTLCRLAIGDFIFEAQD